MMHRTCLIRLLSAIILFFLLGHKPASAQEDPLWLDIGAFQNLYAAGGATVESEMDNVGMQWPAVLRLSGHTRAEAFWIGVKNWRDPDGELHPYRVFLNGPRAPDTEYTVLDHQVVGRWAPTDITVHGEPGGQHDVFVGSVDPSLPADRMALTRIRTGLGIDMERRVYAFSNEYHDDYHIIVRTFTNSGNVDGDDDIELPDQVVNEAFFFNIWRWTGRAQAADHGPDGQLWGKFNMIDVVGDGHEEYPVDFTAIFSWAGHDPSFATTSWDPLGSPMIEQRSSNAPRDTAGRLAGMSMQGLVVLHADTSPADPTYDPAVQPHTLGFLDMDEPLTAQGANPRDYYELGILTRENPGIMPGGSSRMYPHYADRIEPSGAFWTPSNDASNGKQGGHGATVAYGPYTLAPGERVTIVEALAIGGLSYDAAMEIGAAFKRSGADDETLIEYDANSDSVVSRAPFDYAQLNTGAERLTKNEWFMTTRDSLFNSMRLATEVWNRSGRLSTYIFEALPAPPRRFDVSSTRETILLSWAAQSGHSDPEYWDIYRTVQYVDRLPYERIARLPGSARSFEDTAVQPNVNYFYYLVAVGQETSPDPLGIAGAPSGHPFSSNRYYTQTYEPARLASTAELPESGINLVPLVPNPFSSSTTISYAVSGPTHVRVSILNLIGQEIKVLVDRRFEDDFAEDIVWDGRNQSGQLVSSGVYYCQVSTPITVEVQPVVFVR